MRAARARRTSGSSVRGIADKNNKWWDVRGAEPHAELLSSFVRRTAEDGCPTQICHTRSGHADTAALPQLHYLVQHAMRDFPLRGLGNLYYFAVRDDRDRVAVGIKTDALARDVIYYNCIERFRRQLLARVFEHVLRLSRKSDDDLLGLPARHFRQDIGCRFQFQLHVALTLDLLTCRRFRPEVCYCRSLD